MILKNLSLQNFRNYGKKSFSFDKNTTFIVGGNTSGKTNLIEAIYFLSCGQSFRAEKDQEAISFGENLSRISALTDSQDLEVVISWGQEDSALPKFKRYFVNRVVKRQIDFVGNLPSVLFIPSDLNIIVDSPATRRNFLNDVLEQTDRDYRFSLSQYLKGLRQRNALLQKVKESGFRNKKLFEYWDEILIKNGEIITKERSEFIEFANSFQKEIFDLVLFYDKSLISKERLFSYEKAEEGAGVTLVGPHRDDFSVSMFDPPAGGQVTTHDVRLFGSRGQQRLAVLQLKIIQLDFIEKRLLESPILLLDDIFSELDNEHIDLVFQLLNNQQTIITTTHQEFIPKKLLQEVKIIKLTKDDK